MSELLKRQKMWVPGILPLSFSDPGRLPLPVSLCAVRPRRPEQRTDASRSRDGGRDPRATDTLRGGRCDPVTNPVRPAVQGQLWESGADAVTHTWSLGCWQELGQPGAQDLPAGLEGWQDATTQLGKRSRLPALGFLSPSGTDVPATAATRPPHSAKLGTRAGPHAVA